MELLEQPSRDGSETDSGWSDELQNCEKSIPVSSFALYKDRLSMLPDVTISPPPPLELLVPRQTEGVDETSGLEDHPVSTVARHTGDEMSEDQKLNDSETVCQNLSASDSNLRTVKIQADGSTKSVSQKPDDLLLLHRNVRSKAEHLGIMSMQYLPKRPLSQLVCSGTFNHASTHDFASNGGLHLGRSANSRSSEGQWRSAQSVLEQIQTARSFRQRLHDPTAHQMGETNPKTQRDPYGHVKDLSPYSSPSSALDALLAEAYSCGVTDENSLQENFLVASNDCDSVRNSGTSVRSASSSRLSMIEEKQTVELRKLKRELDMANEKIRSLTTQLDMNIVLVTSYGQNLESMTERHKNLMIVLDEKNEELQKLYSCVTGCTSCSENSKLIRSSSQNSVLKRQRSSSISSFPAESKLEDTSISLQVSSGSVGSLNSQSSSCSAASQPAVAIADNTGTGTLPRKSKKNWLKTSISRAFSGRKKPSPLLMVPAIANMQQESSNYQPEFDAESCSTSVAQSPSPFKRTFCDDEEKDDCLQKQLKEDRDMEIMDLKLEALSSAQKIEQLQETVVKLKRQIASLKAERMNADDTTADDSAPNGSCGESSAVGQLASAQPSSFVHGHQRLQSQESFSFSSPKFLHKFSLQNSLHVVSADDSCVSTKPLNPVTRRCTEYDRKKPVGAKLETSS